MLKNFLLIYFVFLINLQSDMLEDKIQNFLGLEEYNKHNKLISILFKNKREFIIGDKLKLIKILKVLKQNGLLRLKYCTPKNLRIKFNIPNSPIRSIKILNETLKSLGYYYYFTEQSLFHEDGSLEWIINLQTEYAIDPLFLTKELKLKEIFVKDITKKNLTHWIYSLDTKNGKIVKSIKIDLNEKISLEKPLNNYLVKIKGGNKLTVSSKNLNRWYPYIIFYNEDLEVLKTIERKRVYKKIKIDIPQNTQYIKIGDIYNLINIKRGLSITVQGAKTGEN
jgi:hypothetical protein